MLVHTSALSLSRTSLGQGAQRASPHAELAAFSTYLREPGCYSVPNSPPLRHPDSPLATPVPRYLRYWTVVSLVLLRFTTIECRIPPVREYDVSAWGSGPNRSRLNTLRYDRRAMTTHQSQSRHDTIMPADTMLCKSMHSSPKGCACVAHYAVSSNTLSSRHTFRGTAAHIL